MEVIKEYLIVNSHAGSSYSAHCSDIDGCVATGATVGEVTHAMQEALQLHVDGMLEDGDEVARPNSTPAFVSVSVRKKRAHRVA